MRISKLFALLIIVCLFTACKDDEQVNHLPGSWRLGSSFVDGFGSNGMGGMEFNEDLSGEMEFWVLIENDTFRREGAFTYTHDRENVLINLGQEDLVWSRQEDTATEQEFSFDVLFQGVEYNVIIEMNK